MKAFEISKRNATKIGPMPESPEITGNYRCPHCGNRERFIGYDDRGFPGDDCECGKEICECLVTLRQPFRVNARGEVTYEAFTGGGNGAEIGSYDRIDCGCCGTQVWPPSRQAETRPLSDRPANPHSLAAKAADETVYRTGNRPAGHFRRKPRRRNSGPLSGDKRP